VDEAVLKRLPQVAHGRVLACDLMTRGVTVGLPPNEKNDEKSFGELFVGIPSQEEDGRLPDRSRMSQVKRLEELDSIGEWCLDAECMVLYALLPEEAGSAVSPIEFSRLSKPFFTLDKCSGVRIRNLTFECSLSDGVVIDGDDNEVVGCVFRNLAGTGVVVRGKHNLIQSVDVHDVGTEALSVAENCDNEVRDCRMSHIGEDYTANLTIEPLRQVLLSTTAKRNAGRNAPAVRNGVSTSPLPRGRFTAAKVKARVDIDGTLLREEWDSTAVCGRVRIETEPSRVNSYVGPEIPSFWKQHEAFTPAVKRGPPCTLYVMAGADGLYAAFDVLSTGVRPLVTEGSLKSMEGVMLMFGPLDSSVTTVFHGLVSGKFQTNKEMNKDVRYAAKVLGNAQWRCEWFIPWNALGGRPASGTAIGFNAAVLQRADNRTLMWRESKGELVIP